MVKGILSASGISDILAIVLVAGAVGGCQASTAACMAAGAIVEMMGGTPRQMGRNTTHCVAKLIGPCR